MEIKVCRRHGFREGTAGRLLQRERAMTMHHRVHKEEMQDSSRGMRDVREKILEKRGHYIGES